MKNIKKLFSWCLIMYSRYVNIGKKKKKNKTQQGYSEIELRAIIREEVNIMFGEAVRNVEAERQVNNLISEVIGDKAL